MSIAISLRSEVLKTKRTAAFYFTLIGAGIVPFLILFSIITHGLPDKERTTKDPINGLFNMSGEMNGLAILPLFVVLICTLLPQIEYRNNSWKQVLSSPQTKLNVFFAKFFNIQLLMLLFIVASHVFMWVVIVVAHFMLPNLKVLEHSFDGMKVLQSAAHSYAGVLGICALQFWIGLRSRNFLAPVSIGFICWLISTVLVFEYSLPSTVYIPYSFPAIRFSIFRGQLAQVEWTSFGYCVGLLFLGFLDFSRRKLAK